METLENTTMPFVNEQPTSPKIFGLKAIYPAAFVGGPLAAGYIIAHNFKVFGQPEKSRNTWIISILFAVLLFLVVFNLPANIKIPNVLIPLIYTGIAYGAMFYSQEKQIEAYLQKGGSLFNGWKIAGVALISLLITGTCVFAYVYFTDPVFTSSTKSYGTSENVIMYPKGTITEAEVDKIEQSLERTGVFVNSRTINVYLDKSNGNYEITFAMLKDSWNEPQTIADFKVIQQEIQQDFPAAHIVIKMSSQESYSDVKKVLD
ncbi:hypothetical protein BH11BAC7_BH11BAC7_08760 [soil metagenome]